MSILQQYVIGPVRVWGFNRLRQQTIAPFERQVFFLHSSEDTDLVNLIEINFPKGINPYFARRWKEPRPPLPKILDQLCSSTGAFMLWTQNIAKNPETRDWVLFELGVARSLVDLGILKGIWGWRATDCELTDLLKSITDFTPFDRNDPNDCARIVMQMREIALTQI